jgi:hypothetical protein
MNKNPDIFYRNDTLEIYKQGAIRRVQEGCFPKPPSTKDEWDIFIDAVWYLQIQTPHVPLKRTPIECRELE